MKEIGDELEAHNSGSCPSSTLKHTHAQRQIRKYTQIPHAHTHKYTHKHTHITTHTVS